MLYNPILFLIPKFLELFLMPKTPLQSLKTQNWTKPQFFNCKSNSTITNVHQYVRQQQNQHEIIILHSSSYHSSFIILHSSFLHFVTFKLLSLFTKQCPFTWNFAIQPKKFHKTKSSTLKDTPPKVRNSELGLNHF